LHGPFAHVARRLLWALPTMWAIVTVSVFLLRLAPGGPFDADRALHPQVEANLRAAYHLDRPLAEQYARYLAGLLTADLGPSLKYKDYSVAELIAAAAPVSALVGGLALALALVLGIWAGTQAAANPHGAAGRWLGPLSLLGIALPSFVLAPVLAWVLGIWAGWLPVGGWGEGGIRYLVLPVLTLALPYAATIARLTRSSAEAVLRAPHVRTARAKGLPPDWVLDRHVVRLALLPVVSFIGPAAAALVAGSVVVETLFGLPGLGRYFSQAALNRDYTLVMGIVVLTGAAMLVLNLLADLAYGLLDPRIGASQARGG
jgi:oligopeptide transport system permease protein